MAARLDSSTSPEIYAESSLDSALQAGEIDAASAYYTQAIELHLDYIPLPAVINLGNPAGTSFYSTAHITTTSGTVHSGGSPLVMDITTIGKADSGRDRIREVHAVEGGPGAVQEGGFTLLTPTGHGPGSRPRSRVSWAASPAAAAGGAVRGPEPSGQPRPAGPG